MPFAAPGGGGDQSATPMPTPAPVPVTEGVTLVARWGSAGSGDGEFRNPTDIALDAAGNVYVADIGNRRVQVFSVGLPE